ncbi:MAG: HAD hydrolase family protein [Pseudohongiellaceae bacterium]
MLLLDVDGVLTDGRLYYSESGEELKVFNTLDGHGLKLLRAAGVRTGIISGRNSPALLRRADELGMDIVVLGREDKLNALNEILASEGCAASQVAYAGDDLPDLPIIHRVGLGISVANAHHEIRRAAMAVTDAKGGHGAVREICDFLLQARGAYEEMLSRFQ